MVSDEKDDAGDKAKLAVRQIAVSALAAPGATPAERQFAQAVLGALEAVKAELPAEDAGTAQVFNRQLDAVLDAANASHGARDRLTRRVHMAGAIARAGLVLIEAGELAALVYRDID